MFRIESMKQLPAMERVAVSAVTLLNVFSSTKKGSFAAADLLGSGEEQRTRLFDRRIDERVLTFCPVERAFRGRKTGSGWPRVRPRCGR